MAMAKLIRCIYCLEDKPPEAFNREHVVPEAFGVFANNLVLLKTVCEGCNSTFGRELDLFLGRDSFEGIILRPQYGVAKRRSPGSRFKPRRLIIALDGPGDWKGTLVEVTGYQGAPIGGRLVINFINQVVFLKKGSTEKVHIPTESVPNRSELNTALDPRPQAVFGPSPETRLAMIAKLKSLGYEFTAYREGPRYVDSVEDNQAPLEVSGQIDNTIRRAVSKIAFNYAAHIHGAEFVLRDCFNPARRFIRFGEKPEWPIPAVRYSTDPILADETKNYARAMGHIVVMEWDAARRGINARVSLFNHHAYQIRLCHQFDGIYREIRSGHHFNIPTKKIYPMAGFDKRISIATFRPSK